MSYSGLLRKGSFRSKDTELGVIAISVETEGFGETNYTRTIADNKIIDVDRPAPRDSATCTHRDDEEMLLAESFSGDPPRRGPGRERTANLALTVAALSRGPNRHPLTLPKKKVKTISEN